MGKATRWLKAIFGIRSNKDPKDNNRGSSSFGHSGRNDHSATGGGLGVGGGLCHNPATIPPNITAAEAAWVQSFYNQSGKEQSKHAIVVAAATAAAADAAVAAAQAAAAVVRLTSHGRGSMFEGGREKWAAVKIQSTFRAYLARKARRALRGLVKLQALVRGYLVRKQATATLNGMQALIRAQAVIRAKRSPQGLTTESENPARPQLQSRVVLHKSMEMVVDDNGSENSGASASVYSKRLSSSFESRAAANPMEDIPRVVEVDTGRPRILSSRSRRPNMTCSECGDDPSYQSLPYSLPCHFPPPHHLYNHPSSHHLHFYCPEWGWPAGGGSECSRFSTAQSTPRFITSGSCNPTLMSTTPPPAPKSVCAENFFRSSNPNPNYMANTQSFMAKLRSQSAPKQRPDTMTSTGAGGGGGARQRLSLNELMESRSSLSGVRMQRSCSQAQEAISFKNAVMGKFDKSSEFIRDPVHSTSDLAEDEDEDEEDDGSSMGVEAYGVATVPSYVLTMMTQLAS
ncbi:hypothetical protein Dimus_026653 [Dionaea muscipula]